MQKKRANKSLFSPSLEYPSASCREKRRGGPPKHLGAEAGLASANFASVPRSLLRGASFLEQNTALAFLIITVALGVVYFIITFFSGYNIGAWRDDSIYLATATSLAQGDGYRHPEIPGSPWETKYPPLYPFILSAILKATGDYSNNTILLFLPNAFFSAALVTISILYIRKALSASWKVAAATGLLTSINPTTVSFTQVLMSEPLYGLLAIAALWFTDVYCEKGDGLRVQVKSVASAVLCALSYFTRSIGISLMAAVLAKVFIQRKWKQLILLFGFFIICIAAYQLWKMHAAADNGFLQTFRLTQYFLDYSIWMPHSVSDLMRVVKQNFFKTIVVVGTYQIPWPRHWFSAQNLFVMHALSYSSIFLLGTGFVASASRRWTTVHFYALFYLGVILVWPFQPLRFLVPWTPFIIFWIFEGINHWSKKIEKMEFQVTRKKNLGSIISIGFFSGVMLLSVVEVFKLPERFFEQNENASERSAISDWIRENTKTNDIIASLDPASLYLETGRKGFDLWPIDDPCRILYSPERTWIDFYSQPVKSEMDLVFEEMKESLLRTYARANIDWVVTGTSADETSAVLYFIANKNPKIFHPVYSSSSGRTIIYRFEMPLWQGKDTLGVKP